jgi:glutamate-1-semialdehyde 2,1-aminomutase
MGVVGPAPGYLEALRELTWQHGALLIFDEVITGFRLSPGGAQQLYGVCPDLTCLGNIIGGGLPVGAFGGRLDIMERLAPLGPVYQAGSLSGNPLAMAAGCATLDALMRPGAYERLEALSRRLHEGLVEAALDAKVEVCVNRVGSMLSVFLCRGPVTDYASARTADTQGFARFFHALLERGVCFPPAQLEAAFVSLAHTEADVDATIRAAAEAFHLLS